MEDSVSVYSLGVYIYNKKKKRSVDDTVSVCADGVYISYGRNPNGTIRLEKKVRQIVRTIPFQIVLTERILTIVTNSVAYSVPVCVDGVYAAISDKECERCGVRLC